MERNRSQHYDVNIEKLLSKRTYVLVLFVAIKASAEIVSFHWYLTSMSRYYDMKKPRRKKLKLSHGRNVDLLLMNLFCRKIEAKRICMTLQHSSLDNGAQRNILFYLEAIPRYWKNETLLYMHIGSVSSNMRVSKSQKVDQYCRWVRRSTFQVHQGQTGLKIFPDHLVLSLYFM